MSAKNVGYARVSSNDQNLDVQLSQLRFIGCDPIFQEKASGADDTRSELKKALTYVQAGDTLTVCKLDRIARSTKHLLQIVDTLEKRKVAFRILNISLDTGTPTGKLMLTILAAVATFERDIMLERQAEGIKRAKAAGVYKGKAPVIADANRENVLTMRREGVPHGEIAATLGIGIATVYRICKRATEVLYAEPAPVAKGHVNPDAQTAVDVWQQPGIPVVEDTLEAMRRKYNWGGQS
jgi:DNA invertase Pin-like site-specific DNA recombinase